MGFMLFVSVLSGSVYGKILMGRVVIVGCHGRILAVGFSNLLPG